MNNLGVVNPKDSRCVTLCMTVSRTVGKMTFYNLWRRYRGLDKNGGCNFPDYPEKGWTFVKEEFCDDDVANAWKEGCCQTPVLNKFLPTIKILSFMNRQLQK